jgi:hypothetical protein
MPVMISQAKPGQKNYGLLQKGSDRFILQMHRQFEISIEEIENAVALFGKNRKAIERFFEQKIVHELQWKSFAWVKQWQAV